MKRSTMKWMIAAATLVVAAGSASAQGLKADVPFTFRAGNTVMAPGTYQVKLTHSAGSSWFVLQNDDTGRSVMLAQFTISNARKEWIADGAPKLGFECAGSNCVLREVWPGADASAYHIRGPKLGSDEPVRMAEIRMTQVKAD